jgi:FkbM family methyltransferase
VSAIEPARALLRRIRDHWDPDLRRRRARHRELNADLSPGAFALRQGVAFKIDPESRESMEYFATRSKEMCREMDSFLSATRECSRLLDIGALHGVFSLAFTASRERGRAVAVEPSSAARAILQRNVELNPFLGIEISNSALGRAPGEIRMRQNWQHLEALGDGESAPGEVIVAVQTADQLCESLDFRPDVLKIDVEGFEADILAGARRLIAARPRILLELHPRILPKFESSASGLIELLRSWDYRVEPISLRRIPPEAKLRQRNSLRVLAVPIAGGTGPS